MKKAQWTIQDSVTAQQKAAFEQDGDNGTLNEKTKITLSEAAKVCESVEKEANKLVQKVGKMNLSPSGNKVSKYIGHKNTSNTIF